jgi:hypothetical protein
VDAGTNIVVYLIVRRRPRDHVPSILVEQRVDVRMDDWGIDSPDKNRVRTVVGYAIDLAKQICLRITEKWQAVVSLSPGAHAESIFAFELAAKGLREPRMKAP